MAGKTNRKHGRDIKKCQRYRMSGRREKNKLRRIFRSNGLAAARSYYNKHGMTGWDRIIPKKHKKKQVVSRSLRKET